MKKGGFAVAAVAGLATCLSMGTASADNVFIFLEQLGVNGGAETLVASGTNTADFSGSYGPLFTVNLVTGFAPTAPGLLNSTLQITVGTIPSGTPQLLVAVYVTGLPPPPPDMGAFASAFTSNIQGGISQNMSTYVNLRNDTVPGNETFVGGTGEFRPGGPPPQVISFTSVPGISEPYSVVGLYLINTSAGPGGTSNATIDIAIVPAPIVGAGLPGLIAALGGVIAMERRRRKQLA